MLIENECFTTFNQLGMGRGSEKPKFVIYKISDDYSTVLVDQSSSDTDWEAFLAKLKSAVDINGTPAPRYAAYGVEYDLGTEGKR